MSFALYRKYRSQSFDTIVGQEHITETLKRSVDNHSFSHAYLLTGLRGVGKTSIARIFAAYVNGIEYEEVENNPDIIEIDAASNRKIDEIRDLREKVIIAPSNLKYKVYIVDEVHMLTREAFNALLKTLEEPPKHCILILATTDYHKLPDTIVSRCVRFSFRSISNKDIIDHLAKVAKKEKIKIDEQALETIASHSSGSLRDALTVLDQARNISESIDQRNIESLLGLANHELIDKIYDSFLSASAKQIIDTIENSKTTGVSPRQVIIQLAELIRSKVKQDGEEKLINLLDGLIRISDYSDKWLALEVCLLKNIDRRNTAKINRRVQDKTETPENEETASQGEMPTKTSEIKDSDELWQQVLEELKKTNSTLYGVARMAEANFNDSVLELKLKFNFHKKQLDNERNKVKIIDIINKYNSNIMSISTTIADDQSNNGTYDNSKDISNISNIFGSAEMLE